MGLVAVLSITDTTQLWHLAAVAFVTGMGMAFYYPAYSAWLPSLVPESDLMAVNGFEGMVRPTIGQAIGPGVAGAVVGAVSAGAAISVAAGAALAGLVALTLVPLTPVRREVDPDAEPQHPIRSAVADMREGFVYMVRTPWLLATLLFASVMILVMMGPFEVLIPFLIKDRLGGGPGDHALVMAAFGIGGALGSLAMASFKMPRRYLTVMNLMWGVGCLPFLVMGFDRVCVGRGRRGVRAGRDVLGADGHLGHAAPASGAAPHAGPGRVARLLRVDQPDADLDGPGRSGGRRHRAAHDVPDRRDRARRRRGGRDRLGQAAGRRDRPSPQGRGRLSEASTSSLWRWPTVS